ncbi:DUF6153 family protein [Streptomyces corynorhini]|uniref:DUF1328 domain-containing protein n=1 Tax=Streptomyces corynorhini TaxID=2282652 RepID=A0A370BES6_9ACTN|nr:DUF6153 family protein [Streptomyces corynorhini]RDG38323.1 hypothetical protein DVH02_09710 [Streptomyces corynorhini]
MRRPPRGGHPHPRTRLALLLAVVAGLLAMHGLAPASALASHPVSGGMAAHDVAADAAHCAAPGHRDGGGHAEHADATCAATGTSGGPVLPSALAPGPLQDPDRPTAAWPAGAGGRGDRAPPSLSLLPLLRI